MKSKDKNPEEDTEKDNLMPNPNDFDEGDYEDIDDNIPDLEVENISPLKDEKKKKNSFKKILINGAVSVNQTQYGSNNKQNHGGN